MRYQHANKCLDGSVRLLTLPMLYNTNDFNIWVEKIFSGSEAHISNKIF